MEKIIYRVLESNVLKDDVIDRYKKEIDSLMKYKNVVNLDLITIEEGYYVYCFIYGQIKDWKYFASSNKEDINGMVDIECDFPSGKFLFNNLKRNMNYKEVESYNEYNIFNINDIDETNKEFYKVMNDKCIDSICQRHRILLTDRANKIDVTPIREFNELEKELYFEKVYKIHYVDNKNNYVSILSGVNNVFYKLDFMYSDLYKTFYKKLKNTVVYIPMFLKDIYYDKAFDVYLKTIDELRYINEKELYKKIKNNYNNESHPNYYFYLLQGIFFFKKKEYLKYYKIDFNNNYLNILLDLFLTYNYQNISGLKLSEFIEFNLLHDNSLKYKLRLLDTSFRLNNVDAKKKLLDHYLNPRYYNEYYLKRYS